MLDCESVLFKDLFESAEYGSIYTFAYSRAFCLVEIDQ